VPFALPQPRIFSWRHFGIGLVAVALFYAALAGWVYLSGDAFWERQSQSLPSKTVAVGRAIPPAPLAQAEALPLNREIPSEGLTPAPAEGLYETSPLTNTILPKVRETDGLTPFRAYRRPFNPLAADKPVIALAVVDLGISQAATESALRRMPPEVSFVFSPYSDALEFWMTESRAKGHEVWLTLPAQTDDYPRDDAGPHTLLTNAGDSENQRKLFWLMARPQGFAGFVTPYRTVFMDSPGDMRPVLYEILRRGLGLINTAENPDPNIAALDRELPGAYGQASTFLDDALDAEAINESLRQLEAAAQEKGYASAFLRPTPAGYKAVLEWLDTLPGKGFMLAPLSIQTGQR